MSNPLEMMLAAIFSFLVVAGIWKSAQLNTQYLNDWLSKVDDPNDPNTRGQK